MKKQLLIIAAMMALLLAFGCGNDDEPDPTAACVQSDWVGTYTGTCNGEAVELKITASGSTDVEYAIVITGVSSQGPLTYSGDGCTASHSATILGETTTYTFVLSGTSMNVKTVGDRVNALADCSNEATLTK